MEHVQYVGPVEAYRGHTALMQATDDPHKVRVQFDRPLTDHPVEAPLSGDMTHGWFLFQASDWRATADITEVAAL